MEKSRPCLCAVLSHDGTSTPYGTITAGMFCLTTKVGDAWGAVPGSWGAAGSRTVPEVAVSPPAPPDEAALPFTISSAEGTGAEGAPSALAGVARPGVSPRERPRPSATAMLPQRC
ncbi:MAG: hypothetical protein MR415_09965, partial [Coriobacteriaceae bacterium]|nr:hypothetical protein [Coriobacteriaceae bacterium]